MGSKKAGDNLKLTVKPDQWGKGKPGKQWAGVYEVKELSMAEEADISQEIINDARSKGISPMSNSKQYDLLRLRKVVKYPETAPKEIETMPGKLYRVLQRADQMLNGVSEDEINFLQRSFTQKDIKI